LGRVSDEDLVRWYRSADLVVLPTQELEGFGLATAEALASGTPVLGTPAGATPELLTDLDPGLVAADVTPDAIADAVIAMTSDRTRLLALASQARGSRPPGHELASHRAAAPRGLRGTRSRWRPCTTSRRR
jgi:glycosyltransferase involved in cell wall biosynthesis